MNGPRDYHTRGSKSEKGKYHMISRVESKRMIQLHLFTDQKRPIVTENKPMVIKGEGEGRDKLGI